MFKKILIANRGEIACRVIKTARRMGIKTVAVYSDADSDALHVEMADESIAIGPAPSSQSYLDIDKILGAIKKTKADAVHPGYGFLSENASFARKLKRNGIAFIGPGVHAITKMGDKIESKKLADKAGVSTVPGHAAELDTPAQAVKAAKKVGYPVMLKASAGGGGKGMRIARNDAEARDGFSAARREAKSSFGDDRVFVEKFIEQPRHIEIQVLADSHGNTIYLGERECSIQRRHQKVIEEAPSPFLDEKTRAAMGEQAVKLSKAVKYVSAGTVEFIVDNKRNFYFLEMNTRLQVEHPVTEMVTGIDLVEQMIRIAAGKKMTLKQTDISPKGWAMESRVYAENPFRGFLPSIGRLSHFVGPEENANVRLDTGVTEGDEISIHYDPMIAKLVTYGSDRDEAIARMGQALDAFYIRGVDHNIAFLAAIMSHSRFQSGKLSTDFIADEYGDSFNSADVPHDEPGLLMAVAASIHRAYQERAASISGQCDGHERTVLADWIVLMDGESHSVSTQVVTGGHDVTINSDDGEENWHVRSDWQLGEPLYHAQINGRIVCLQVERSGVAYRLTHSGLSIDVRVLKSKAAQLYALMPIKVAPDMSKIVASPMPGLLMSLAVKEGQKVKGGDTLAVIEAMKMENVLNAEQ
ncbi:MAG: acetyl/propionyl/methylcrotonyl-CoA carboxylase subunit alpha, partial [Rhodospirillaceae bacterium]|nr:acetyl/propionyl/methylcrotonyl-CoA carboxylase subunit alpha [Rhodospirillaceae bacterium]